MTGFYMNYNNRLNQVKSTVITEAVIGGALL